MDGGDSFKKGKTAEELRAETILQGMALMGYDALNIGEGELSLGLDFFTRLAATSKVPMLSLNLGNLPGVQPAVFKKIGGLTVAITGITASTFLTANVDAIRSNNTNNPVGELKRLLPKLRQQADIVILLSHLGHEGTVNLLQFNDLKGIDVAVAAHGRNMLTSAATVADTVVVQNSMGGEYLGLLKLQISDTGSISVINNQVIALDDSMPIDDKALALMNSFHSEEKVTLDSRDKKEQEQLKPLESKYLAMSPQQFFDEVKKKQIADGKSFPLGPVNLQ